MSEAGFWAGRVCRARGLTGEQGVMIPRANVRHLMLADEVVAAVAAGEFHVWALESVDDGIERLTGCPAGVRGADGAFTEGSVHRRVEDASAATPTCCATSRRGLRVAPMAHAASETAGPRRRDGRLRRAPGRRGPAPFAWIERSGNRVPNPAVLFMALCAGVIVLSQVLDWIGVTSEVVSPTGHDVVRHAFAIRGLLSGAGIRFMVVTILVTS